MSPPLLAVIAVVSVAEVRPDERVLKVHISLADVEGALVAEVRPDERVLKDKISGR